MRIRDCATFARWLLIHAGLHSDECPCPGEHVFKLFGYKTGNKPLTNRGRKGIPAKLYELNGDWSLILVYQAKDEKTIEKVFLANSR